MEFDVSCEYHVPFRQDSPLVGFGFACRSSRSLIHSKTRRCIVSVTLNGKFRLVPPPDISISCCHVKPCFSDSSCFWAAARASCFLIRL